MPTITRVRPILLSAPYGAETSMENLLHLPSGLRTAGFVEITLSDGSVGVGEGYLAVFAPHVFRSIVELISPGLIGRDASDISARCDDMVAMTGYWSLQGAARHVISAVEIALHDSAAKAAGLPLWRFLGGVQPRALRAYASGGDARTPAAMETEIASVAELGIDVFKIRARAHQLEKVRWTQLAAAASGVGIAIDMTQNLAVRSQGPAEVLTFIDQVVAGSGVPPVFVEEVLGPDLIAELPGLAASTAVPIAGGEIVTTADELCERVKRLSYDIVQPDATVIGGIRPVLDVFDAARSVDVDVYVHCWGAGIGVLANYHAALAGGGTVVEWPMPDFPLRSELVRGAATIIDGHVSLSDKPGLGIDLTPDIERDFPFREEAVYNCLVDPAVAATGWLPG